MTNDVGKRASMEFGISLPKEYLEFLRKHSDRIERLSFDYGAGPEPVSLRQFLCSPGRLIALNRRFRASWRNFDPDKPTNYGLFWAIGETIGGDCYLIAISDPKVRVHFCDHETGDSWQICRSLRGFCQYLTRRSKALARS